MAYKQPKTGFDMDNLRDDRSRENRVNNNYAAMAAEAELTRDPDAEGYKPEVTPEATEGTLKVGQIQGKSLTRFQAEMAARFGKKG